MYIWCFHKNDQHGPCMVRSKPRVWTWELRVTVLSENSGISNNTTAVSDSLYSQPTSTSLLNSLPGTTVLWYRNMHHTIYVARNREEPRKNKTTVSVAWRDIYHQRLEPSIYRTRTLVWFYLVLTLVYHVENNQDPRKLALRCSHLRPSIRYRHKTHIWWGSMLEIYSAQLIGKHSSSCRIVPDR